jgi:hypothetical protein
MDNLSEKYCRKCQTLSSFTNNECGNCRKKRIEEVNKTLCLQTIEQRIKRLEDIIANSNLKID